MLEHQTKPGVVVVEFLDTLHGGPVALRRMAPPALGSVIALSAGRWRVVESPALVDPTDDQFLVCHVRREG
jgi:hypothetical protein